MRSVSKFTMVLLASTAIASAPAWAQAADTPADTDGGNTIVVTGQRAALVNSAQIKKKTMEIVDSITADDIGKLPDPNVAETLTRIPGVQGYRYGGEGASPVGDGSGLTIRGLSGQTSSLVDGRAYFTAGEREFNIEGAIPGMIAGIDVYKNPSAEHIEGGIGGTVNIRTRMPLDFKGLTVSVAGTGRYNDLAKKLEPEVFGLFSDRWHVGDGEMGLMIAANYQESFNRSDSNPAGGGTSIRQAIRADDPGYASAGGDSAYTGRSDVWYLADATCTTGPCPGLISAVGEGSHIFQEDIHRIRKGVNAAFQWRFNPQLEFYAQGNYNYYLYDQRYRFLFLNDSRTVRNLTTTPFNLSGDLASRNGSAGDTLVTDRLASGTFLNSTVGQTMGGHEGRPYQTWIGATGLKWHPTAHLDLNLDVSYVKASQTQDNRDVLLNTVPGTKIDITRDLTTHPNGVAISGADLSDPSIYTFARYDNGANQTWQDDGLAVAVDGTYSFDNSFLQDLKFGLRHATHRDNYSNYSFGGKSLGGVPVVGGGLQDLVMNSPTNWMDGQSGYSGGYVVFDPLALLGDNVRNRFPSAGIPSEGSLPENLTARRYSREKTIGGYAQADFGREGDRIRGNVGVRIVHTDLFARAMVQSYVDDGSGTLVPGAIIPAERSNSYTDVLPSANLTWYATPDTLVRFGYAKGLTRAALADLNPSINVNTSNGTGSAGNPDLRPLRANSFDLALEHYWGNGNYVSVDGFYKAIDGFFNGVQDCETVPNAPAYTGANITGCTNGQYLITKNVNANKGNARGVEFSFQTFFDFLPGVLQHFGASGSYTYLATKNPVRFALAGPIYDVPMPFQSKHNFSLSGLYQDKFMSARVVYTYRSDFVLFGVAPDPINGRYVKGYGLLDASVNFNLAHDLTLSINASNITNKGLDRYVGEPGTVVTDVERQHFLNGRNFGIGLRYRFGG